MTHLKHLVCSSVADRVEIQVGEIHNEVAEIAQKAGLHTHLLIYSFLTSH